MRVGGRSVKRALRAPLEAGHYRALAGMARHYPDLLDSSRRYLTGAGAYPHRCRVRTPVGIHAPTLHSSHDMLTVNEVFCRQDYRSPADLGVAVDVGANIGIASLYFLTRNASSRVYAFEPDPRNVERLRANLAGYAARLRLEAVAVGTADGDAIFGAEPSGRYGALVGSDPEPDGYARTEFPVRVRAMESIIGEVLAREERIDVLKVDTEGSESELVGAISPEHLARISTIYYETNEPTPLHGSRYAFHYSCQTNRLTARG